MTGGSRILENQRRSALQLIDEMRGKLTPGRPFLADLRRELSHHRGFGARDRRLYRELIFTWLRYRPWFDMVRSRDVRGATDLLIALAPEAPELLPLQSDLGVPGGLASRPWPEADARLGELLPGFSFDLQVLLPAWFRAHCPALFTEREILAQVTRPPFWLRAQRGTGAELVQELAAAGIESVYAPDLPGAVRVAGYVELDRHPIVASGRAEVQDIGSQALLALAAPAEGGQWLDFCAGAGGKTLQLAALVGRRGRVVAHDVRREALVETKRRMLRAEIRNIAIEPVLPEVGADRFDGVLVDAPCSASGTWRRHPFLRYQTTQRVVTRYTGQQADILARASRHVAPGGRLVYSTCSLSRSENEGVLGAFLRAHPGFALEPPPGAPGIAARLAPSPSGAVTLMPSVLDSDGYFLACLRRGA